MIRKILLALTVIAVIVAIMVFTGLNPGTVAVDLGIAKYETQISTAFVIAFAIGWIFGLFCTLIFVVKLVNERRKLRKKVRIADAEISSLRTIPLQDAGE